MLASLEEDVSDDGVAQVDNDLKVLVCSKVLAHLIFALCAKVLNLNFCKLAQVVFQLLRF